jgi:histidinol-phosphate aminotransferase
MLLKPGTNAVTSQVSFIVYSIIAKAEGAALVKTPQRDGGFDLEALAKAINAETRIVFLANPNNPTGTLVSADEIDNFLAQVPENVTVVLDEAYCDYADYFAKQRKVPYSRSLDYVREGRNVVILKTFSKAHGLAGVRVGYGFARPEMIKGVADLQTTFSVSLPAQAAALAALEDVEHLKHAVERNALGAEYLARALAGFGHPVRPTWANFLYCELGRDASAFARLLRTEGILVRALGSWGAPTAIRVTIGTQEQNEKFVGAFKKAMTVP